MTTLLTQQIINDTFETCLAHAQQMVPDINWAHPFSYFEMTSPKRAYGYATTDGLVQLNPAFIGTTALNKLTLTIFHELTHLIVGLDKHHNKAFKRMERLLTQHIPRSLSGEIQVKDNNSYPWRLLSTDEQGAVYDLGGAFRRTKKYRDYSPEAGKRMRIKGKLLVSFSYVDYGEPLPKNAITESSFV